MNSMRISASSYSNTAPLIWSFLYGRNHGKVEIILDNAPARSAELLGQNRVDAALVPVIAYQTLDDLRLIPDVCVGARERVRSVCLITKGEELEDVRVVALDASSLTSVVLTKIIFREFLGFEPEWRQTEPSISNMLADADCALTIGDPALTIADSTGGNASVNERAFASDGTLVNTRVSARYRTFDLAELWHHYTGLGFVFAMWMTRWENISIDFAAARDEGLENLDGIIANYMNSLSLSSEEMKRYLTQNVSYSIDDSMRRGMELYFELAYKNRLIAKNKIPIFANMSEPPA
ncbi:MAG: menaquinone biosynthetic enzyme MqnA/MqnD family protein [Pyrinomonadaceae bacterium]